MIIVRKKLELMEVKQFAKYYKTRHSWAGIQSLSDETIAFHISYCHLGVAKGRLYLGCLWWSTVLVSMAISVLKLEGNQRLNREMSFNFVTSDFYMCTLHRIIEKYLSPSLIPLLTLSARLILSVFTFCNVSLPMLLPLEILTCSLERDHVGAIQESGRWGREELGGHRSQHYLFPCEPRRRKGKPMEGKGQNILWSLLSPSALGFFSAHLSWAVFE